MATQEAYATIQQLKKLLEKVESGNDWILQLDLDSASRGIERICNRPSFNPGTEATAKKYRTVDSCLVLIDDIADDETIVVKVDDNCDGVFETTLASTDFQLEPFNRNAWEPVTRITAGDRYFPTNGLRASVEVTAKWGWPEVPDEIVKATLLYAKRLYERRNSPQGVVGFGPNGDSLRIARTDADVMSLIGPYVKAAF